LSCDMRYDDKPYLSPYNVRDQTSMIMVTGVRGK
jgi:hypothetical protein